MSSFIITNASNFNVTCCFDVYRKSFVDLSDDFFFFRSFWVFKSFCIWFVHFTIFNFVPLKWRREWSEWTFCSLDCHSTYVRLQFFVFFFSNILSSGYLFDFVAAPEMGAAACTKRFRFITFRQSTDVKNNCEIITNQASN